MSAKSIGLKSVISINETKDYIYPSIQVGDDNQILKARENEYEDLVDLQSQVDDLLANATTLNTDSQFTLTNALLLSSTIDDISTETTVIDTTQSDTTTLLTTIQSKLDSGDYDTWTSFYMEVLSTDEKIYNTKTLATGDIPESYYFQPDVNLSQGDIAYSVIKFFPSLSYSFDTTPSTIPMLLNWNIKLTWWDSFKEASSEYIQSEGMLWVGLVSQDQQTIYYQVKDGCFSYGGNTDADNTIVVGSGSAIVDMPSGNQQVKLGFFVSSHQQDATGFPIKSVTSWIINNTTDDPQFVIYSLTKI
jgi:hypothetical protein|tara:strand:- start:2166 stop:3077 length:912 start_codon:yes stop_codon:yes gene_type:complete